MIKKLFYPKKDPKEKQKTGTGLSRAITMATAPQMEVIGNREAVIEGCKGILEYDETVIKLNLGKLSVKFCGDDLKVKSMNVESVIVTGFITSIEYLN